MTTSGPSAEPSAKGYDHTPSDFRPAATLEPLRYCVATTVALIAWLLAPAPTVATMGALGAWGYWLAIRHGLKDTRCILGRSWIVLLYLSLASAAGIVVTVLHLF